MTGRSIAPPVLLYFDFVSPYAYLAWQRAKAWRSEGVVVRPMPVVFAGLLKAHGQLGPAEIPAKRRFVIRDCMRLGKRLGVPFQFPGKHPFRSIDALRLCLRDVSGDDQLRVIDALFDAAWAEGKDLSDLPTVRGVLDGLGLDGEALLRRTQMPGVKQALIDATGIAVSRGVFGVPTFVVGEELVWGHDRMDDVRSLIDGEDALDRKLAARLDNEPLGVRRKTERAVTHPQEARYNGVGPQHITLSCDAVQRRVASFAALKTRTERTNSLRLGRNNTNALNLLR